MSSWLGEVYEKYYDLLPDAQVTSSVVKYGAPVALVSYTGYKIWQWTSANPQKPLKSQDIQHEEQSIKEFSGVLKMLPTQYDAGSFKEGNTVAVYIVLRGSLLEIYEANENIPLRELFDEPDIELTFYKKSVYNIKGCFIKLLPQKLDKIFRWEHFYPIEVKLCNDCLVEKILLNENQILETENDNDEKSRSVILFARSDRDKEAWTRRLKTATHSKSFTPNSEDPIISIRAGKPYREKPPLYIHKKIQGLWLNSLLSRIVTDGKTKELIEASLTFQVQELLDNLTFGDKMETLLRLTVHKIDLNNFGTPKIKGISVPYENDLGLWEEILIKYNGLLKIIIEIKLNPRTYGKEDNERPTNQNYDDTPWISRLSYLNYVYLGGVMERTRFYLEINLDLLKGGVAINIPKPPTESAWLGFREGTRLDLSGTLFWGTWRLPFLYCVVNAICDKLCASFDNNFMIPNMKQLHLPMWQQN